MPADPDTARNMGLDGVRWAREGLVDLVTVRPFWEASDLSMRVRLWKRLLEGTNVELAGGQEISVRPYQKLVMSFQTPETSVGAAAAILYGGADRVYLFDYFYDMPGQRTLTAKGACNEGFDCRRDGADQHGDHALPGGARRCGDDVQPRPARGAHA